MGPRPGSFKYLVEEEASEASKGLIRLGVCVVEEECLAESLSSLPEGRVNTAQLPGALQEEIFGNVNSLFSFGLGAKDAQVMRKEFLTTGEKGTEPLAVEEILELAGGRAVKLSMPPPVRVKDPDIGQEVIASSWYIYGAPAGVSGGEAPEEAASDASPQEPAGAPKEQ